MLTVRVERPTEIGPALRKLGLTPPQPTLVVVGGAGRVAEEDLERIRPVLEELMALAERSGAAIVDGGTDAGVMRLLGRARAAAGSPPPLIGVVVEALAAAPGSDPGGERAELEPNHSHAVFVPGESWGDEVPWLALVADALADGAPSVTVLVNGGEIAFDDAAASVDAGRQVLVLEGSGRAADVIAAALRGDSDEQRALALGESGLVHAVDVRQDAGRGLVREVERALTQRR
ncbi:MAG TPA: hypothetical protein VGF23_11895 [Gaiellaceae bacterium]|jgi:hypothetical protein